MWKCADDNTISEVVPMSNNSTLQLIVDEAVGWSDGKRLNLHTTKCKYTCHVFGYVSIFRLFVLQS